LIPSKKDNSFTVRIYSKAIVLFKAQTLKLPLGKKNSISIPEIILKTRGNS